MLLSFCYLEPTNIFYKLFFRLENVKIMTLHYVKIEMICRYNDKIIPCSWQVEIDNQGTRTPYTS